MLGNLDKIDYEEGRQKVEEKLAEIRSEIGEMGDLDIPLTQMFENSASVLEHLENVWETASDRHKSKIAKALFPAGLTCDKKGGVGTPSNAHVMGLYALLEWGDFSMVTPTGIEPVLPA